MVSHLDDDGDYLGHCDKYSVKNIDGWEQECGDIEYHYGPDSPEMKEFLEKHPYDSQFDIITLGPYTQPEMAGYQDYREF